MYLLLLIFITIFVLTFVVVKKNIHIWINSYAKQRIKAKPQIERGTPIDVIFCMVDHFEPIQQGSTAEVERQRINSWLEGYPELASKHKDSNGRPPQHTWFYPGEAYAPEYIEALAELCRKGYGEIELHHHHHNETSDGLRNSLLDCLQEFADHGACKISGNDSAGYAYGFIHGNMALDNSRFDDKWCGVNDEITILKETGCYADFSYPTAPCVSQTKKINSIYYAEDDPNKPKSHNTGIDVATGKMPSGDLMIIQGPLALSWRKRKFGILPTIDNAEVHCNTPGSPDRIDRWIRQHIHVKGIPNWIFVKVSCHGAEDQNYDVLLGQQADAMYSYLEKHYRDRQGYRLHYVTAREFFNIVKAAEAGLKGNPDAFRNFIIPKYNYVTPTN